MKLVIKVKHLVWSESLLVLNSSSGSQHDSDVLSACSTGFTRLWKQLRPSFFLYLLVMPTSEELSSLFRSSSELQPSQTQNQPSTPRNFSLCCCAVVVESPVVFPAAFSTDLPSSCVWILLVCSSHLITSAVQIYSACIHILQTSGSPRTHLLPGTQKYLNCAQSRFPRVMLRCWLSTLVCRKGKRWLKC